MKLDSIIRPLVIAALTAGAAWIIQAESRIASLREAELRHNVTLSRLYRITHSMFAELSENAVLLHKPLPRWPDLTGINP